MKYWIAVVSKDHTMKGVEGGFTQINHGKEAPLKRLTPGDWLVVYSSKISMDTEEKCQAFTAIGQVCDEPIYRVNVREDFQPFRRNVNYFSANDAPIAPLIQYLDFIPNKKSWGYPFRFGFFEISEHDFLLIRSAMLRD